MYNEYSWLSTAFLVCIVIVKCYEKNRQTSSKTARRPWIALAWASGVSLANTLSFFLDISFAMFSASLTCLADIAPFG